MAKRVQNYHGWVIAWEKETQTHQVFTAEEWSMGEGLRYPEFDDCGSVQECKDQIDNY
jgi:ribosomal protein L19